MKILICSAIFLFQISVAHGQPVPPPPMPPSLTQPAPAAPSGPTNANGASGNSKMLGLAEGAVSAGMGVYLMTIGKANFVKGTEDLNAPCGCAVALGQALISKGTMEEMLGASLVSAGAADAMQAAGYGNTGNQIAAGGANPTLSDPGTADPYIQGLLNTANGIAAQSGTTVPALASQADSGGDGGGGGGMGSFASGLPQSVKDGMAKAAKDAQAHYHVSAVALEGGGGGGGAQKSDGAFDLNGILNGLKDRGPASVAGLQKSLNGEAIGVAQDNIFQQITRKYQSKIALRMFLPIQK